MMTTTQVAEDLSVNLDQVLALIRSGKLRATNIALGPIKPRWRISPADLEQFKSANTNEPTPTPSRRRKRAGDGIPEYV